MKAKLFLIIALFSVALVGCKKDNENSVSSIKKNIIGTWEMQNATSVAYDSSGKEVDRQSQDIPAGTRFQFVNENTVKSPGSDDTSNYSIVESNGKATLNVEGSELQVKINGNTMTWISERAVQEDAYSKVVTTIQLKKI